MTSGPSHVLALTKGKTGENIIDEFRDLIGPTDVEEAKTQKPERFVVCSMVKPWYIFQVIVESLISLDLEKLYLVEI